MLESLVPPTSTDEAIIDVLKYSQKDMDAAIARVRAEVGPETKASVSFVWTEILSHLLEADSNNLHCKFSSMKFHFVMAFVHVVSYNFFAVLMF